MRLNEAASPRATCRFIWRSLVFSIRNLYLVDQIQLKLTNKPNWNPLSVARVWLIHTVLRPTWLIWSPNFNRNIIIGIGRQTSGPITQPFRDLSFPTGCLYRADMDASMSDALPWCVIARWLACIARAEDDWSHWLSAQIHVIKLFFAVWQYHRIISATINPWHQVCSCSSRMTRSIQHDWVELSLGKDWTRLYGFASVAWQPTRIVKRVELNTAAARYFVGRLVLDSSQSAYSPELARLSQTDWFWIVQ